MNSDETRMKTNYEFHFIRANPRHSAAKNSNTRIGADNIIGEHGESETIPNHAAPVGQPRWRSGWPVSGFVERHNSMSINPWKRQNQ
jgi:hypothetical protein